MKRERGMTLIEVLVALALTSVVIFASITYTANAYRATGHNLEKQFATQKAMSMLEELKSLVQEQGNSASVLDAFDDGNDYNNVLTTESSVTDPAAPTSGNRSLGGSTWKYTRQISISLLPGTSDNTVRLVNVRVCLDKDDNGDGKPDSLAEVAGVVRTLAGPFPPTQVYDVYALAVENVPGWWVFMSNLIPFVQNAIQNLQSRDPGLEFRVHWITKLAYGRDSEYRPYINSTQDSNQTINYVYFYPGRMPSGSADDFYYTPYNMKGHVLVDGTDTNGYSATTNPNPYALADNYNNAMRYEDELALFNQRVASGQESDDAPTLRILLERMYRDPFKYRNAILINLHGELMPFPPVRNYSDAAKEPAGYPNIRTVTHPENLRYLNTAASVKLRVYSYRTDPDNNTATTNRDWLGQGVGGNVPIVVTLKGITWSPTSGSSDIVAIKGGSDQDGVSGADAYTAVNATTTLSTTGMYYTAASVGSDTVLSLYNSPLKSPEVAAGGGNYAGLNSGERLYGLEYVPSPCEDFTVASSPPTPFTRALTSTHTLSGATCNGGACAKNTARWVITIPSNVLPGGTNGNGLVTIETRINSTTSGTRTDQPPNLSRTYIWRGSDTWIFGDGTAANLPNLPITEKYQIIGDPRHSPYADLKSPHQATGLPAANALGMGYNRYFDDFQNGSANKGTTPGANWQGYYYTGLAATPYGIKNDATTGNDGWDTGIGSLELDMPRIYQVLRTTLMKARTVYTTMTGYSFFYIGLGDEIGYDWANGFSNSIPVNSKPFDGGNTATYEQSIIPPNNCPASVTNGCGVKYIRASTGASYWWGLYWLGELYPDSSYTGGSGWQTVGNLPTGTAAGTFRRAQRGAIGVNLPTGTSLIDVGRRTAEEGSPSFFWAGSSTSTFHQIYSNGTGDLLTSGKEIASRFNYPLSDDIPINRPFDININDTTQNPNHFLQVPYGSATTAGVLAQFYDQSPTTGSKGSALISSADASNNVDFVVVNGISMTGQSGTSFIANWSLLTLIQSFLAAGLYNPSNGYANHIEQLPRVTITSPNPTSNFNNPASIDMGWTREWLRWDGQSYTSNYAANYAETSDLSYAVMYSTDNGATWHYMQDSATATLGARPTSASGHLISSALANPTYKWSVPASSFPQGTYILRVEAYRDALPQHYSYHQYRAFIRR